MNIESRMDEFKKVADKKMVHEEQIRLRMNEFEEVPRKIKFSKDSKEKESELPYGLKRYILCPNCEEIIEIHDMKEKEAIYRCHHCNQDFRVQYQ